MEEGVESDSDEEGRVVNGSGERRIGKLGVGVFDSEYVSGGSGVGAVDHIRVSGKEYDGILGVEFSDSGGCENERCCSKKNWSSFNPGVQDLCGSPVNKESRFNKDCFGVPSSKLPGFNPSFSTSVFVGNVPFTSSVHRLRSLFSEFGVVCDVFIPRKISKFDASRFAFVHFCHEDAAARAIVKLDGGLFDGNKLVVNIARFARTNTSQQCKPMNNGLPNLSMEKKTMVVNPSAITAMVPNSSISKAVSGKLTYAQVVQKCEGSSGNLPSARSKPWKSPSVDGHAARSNHNSTSSEELLGYVKSIDLAAGAGVSYSEVNKNSAGVGSGEITKITSDLYEFDSDYALRVIDVDSGCLIHVGCEEEDYKYVLNELEMCGGKQTVSISIVVEVNVEVLPEEVVDVQKKYAHCVG